MTSLIETAKQPGGDRVLTPGLRETREAADISCAELAARTGYTRQHISALELGISGASRLCIRRLMRELRCNLTDLTSAAP
jgi:transcriptional regulator with XRE-family HTH domain